MTVEPDLKPDVRKVSEIEVVAIGDELLSGATLDSNAAHIGRALEPIGVRVVRKTTVGDRSDAISEAVESALARTGAVITTGGLGPTADDATKPAVAAVFGRELEFREDLWAALLERWSHRGGRIPDTNRSQVEVPVGARVLPNPRGTAPGLLIDDAEIGLCVLLPGVPGEMRMILEGSVVPFLSERGGEGERPFRRVLRTAGIAESAIAEQVGEGLDDLDLEVAYLPQIDGTDIRLTRWSGVAEEARSMLDAAAERLYRTLGVHIYAEGSTDMAETVGALLRERGLTVAVAESCTGGLIGSRLSEWPGSSDFFWGGMIVYDDRAKVESLGVSPSTLAEHGAVSERVAVEMADGAMRRSGADCAVAVTGIAGPTGGSEEKPVGTIWLAVQVEDAMISKRRYYTGTRDMIRARAAQGALDVLRRALLRQTG